MHPTARAFLSALAASPSIREAIGWRLHQEDARTALDVFDAWDEAGCPIDALPEADPTDGDGAVTGNGTPGTVEIPIWATSVRIEFRGARSVEQVGPRTYPLEVIVGGGGAGAVDRVAVPTCPFDGKPCAEGATTCGIGCPLGSAHKRGTLDRATGPGTDGASDGKVTE